MTLNQYSQTLSSQSSLHLKQNEFVLFNIAISDLTKMADFQKHRIVSPISLHWDTGMAMISKGGDW